MQAGSLAREASRLRSRPYCRLLGEEIKQKAATIAIPLPTVDDDVCLVSRVTQAQSSAYISSLYSSRQSGHSNTPATMSKPLKRPIAGPKRSLVGSSSQVKKAVPGARAGPSARGGDEGYLYVAGVRDASQRVSEYRVGHDQSDLTCIA